MPGLDVPKIFLVDELGVLVFDGQDRMLGARSCDALAPGRLCGPLTHTCRAGCITAHY